MRLVQRRAQLVKQMRRVLHRRHLRDAHGSRRSTAHRRTRHRGAAAGLRGTTGPEHPVGNLLDLPSITLPLKTAGPPVGLMLWSQFGPVSGLQRQEFFDYFEGLPMAFALGLSEPTRLALPIPLNRLREVSSGFHLPQFFANVASEGPLLRAMTRARHPEPATPARPRRVAELA